jgi:hypothetical protein
LLVVHVHCANVLLLLDEEVDLDKALLFACEVVELRLADRDSLVVVGVDPGLLMGEQHLELLGLHNWRGNYLIFNNCVGVSVDKILIGNFSKRILKKEIGLF